MRILVVDDDKHLCSIVKRGLTEESYAVDVAYDGEDAEYLAKTSSYDLVILDIMLPKKDGIEVCQNLRLKKISIPILMLTAKDSIDDKVKGLDSGADDYLVKPFAFSELLARVRALIRRESKIISPEIRLGDLVLNTGKREFKRGQETIELSSKEYAILEYFMYHPNIVVTRSMLMEHVWDWAYEGVSNLVDVYIRKLRRKIDEGREKSFLETIRGVGYRLRI